MSIDKYTETQIGVLTKKHLKLGRTRNEILLDIRARYRIVDAVAESIVDSVIKSYKILSLNLAEIYKLEEMLLRTNPMNVIIYLQCIFNFPQDDAIKITKLLQEEATFDKK